MKLKPVTAMIVVFGLLLGSLGHLPSPSQTSLAAPAATIRYAESGGLIGGDCASWGSACELQYALSIAGVGDEIWVQGGVYKPTNGITSGSCQEVHDAFPDAADGDYMIQTEGNPFQVYCFDMANDPTEYLTLQDPGNNYAQYTAGGFSPGTDVRTQYSRVRLLPDTLQIDISDQRYASSNGGSLNHGSTVVQSMPYGVAMDCRAAFSQQGVARIDLRGTPFMVTDDFVQCGWHPGGGATFTEGNQVVDLTGGGDCGVVEPNSASCMEPPYNDAGGRQPILELGYLGPERRATFQLKSGVAIYGGFAGTETSREDRDWEANPTALSGDLLSNDGPNFANNGENSYHVVTGSGIDASAVLDGFTITHGNADYLNYNDSGGGMYSPGSPTLTNVTFSGNFAFSYGGGMFSSGNPTLTNVTFSDNSAWVSGGGMHSYGNPTLANVTFSGNSAGWGGGMVNDGGTPTLTDCEFSGNSASTAAGGMWNSGYSTLTHVTFGGNTADEGGGVYNSGGTLMATDVTFSGNSATDRGGGLFNYRSILTGSRVTVTLNNAERGGGVYTSDAGLNESSVTNVTIIGNTATYGGGIFSGAYATALNAITLTLNAATYGGGMYSGPDIIPPPSNPTLTGVAVISNTAVYGGGVYVVGGSLTGSGATISGNTADDGGGMYNSDSPTVTNFGLIGNTATYAGGGMYNDGGAPALDTITLTLNTAQNGGGMYNDSSSPTGMRITFRHNTASTSGGGMYNDASAPALANASFISNTATYGGGGMYNRGCRDLVCPRLVNTLFNNNAVTGTAGNEGCGGAMYNEGGQPELVNVTFGNNAATRYGGGMADFSWGVVPSNPHLKNCVLWGNTSGDGDPAEDQIYDAPGSLADVGFSCTIQGDQPLPSPFVDAHGADDVPGTADDDLRLAYTSDAIDGGDENPPLLKDILDLDGDGNTLEELPFDLDVNVRRYADENLDSIPDPVGATYSDRRVDQGAYEAGCYAWHMHYGDDRLAEGQKYRLGFHDETLPSTVTISDTLASYASQGAAAILTSARRSYEIAIECAATDTQKDQARLGILKVVWEQATGELLAGNDDMVKSTDMRFSAEFPTLGNQIANQIAASDHFSIAVDIYLSLLLEDDDYTQFLAAQPDRLSYLKVENPEPDPYHDVQRLAEAAARESLASVSLAKSYFRQYTPASKELAGQTLRAGYDRASAMLALLARLARDWAGAQDKAAYATAYQALTQNISEMERIFEYLQQGKNPFGYHEGYIPFLIRYDNSANPESVWNFLNVYDEAYDKDGSHYDLAEDAHVSLMAVARDLDDDQDGLDAALSELDLNYKLPLVELCGLEGTEIDLADCEGGAIGVQVLAIQSALTRFRQTELGLENQLELIRIEQQRAAEVAGIHRATAIMYTQDGAELATLARDEVELTDGKSDMDVATDILGAGLEGFFGGGGDGPKFDWTGALVKGGISLITQAGKSIDEQKTADKLKDIAGKREEIDARQKAHVEYAEAQIVDADSEALIKGCMLEYATLELDRAMAYIALQQELHRLNAMTTQVEYLLARWAEAKRTALEIFSDPGARLYRDWLSEQAQERYDDALDWAFRSGRALDYEMGESWQGADDLFEIVELGTLEDAFIQMNTDFNDWKPSIPPEPAYTAIPLSQALGFADSWEVIGGAPVFTTAREKFRAYVSDSGNWVDLNNDGNARSLRLTFQTSIFDTSEGLNLFSTGVFNDKILRVAPALIGDAARLDPNTNNSSVRLRQLGTCTLRSKDAAIGGQDSFKAYDFEHAIKEGDPIEARLNSYHEWIDDEDLAESEIDTRGSLGLLWRSVGCTKWVLTIAKEGIDAENGDMDFAYLEDILLYVKHRNFALQTPGLAASSASQRIEPMHVEPQLIAEAEQAYRYTGTLIPEQPDRLPAGELTLYLEQNGSDVAGVIEADGLLGFAADCEPGQGPALNGTVTDGRFILTSELYSGAGGITRTLALTTTTVYTDGVRIAGEYVQSILGLAPETIEVRGAFTMTQAMGSPQASFSATPSTGPAPLPVEFLDWSVGNPTSWAWDFGDGGTSTEQHPTHTYIQAGPFTVTLTVSNLFGSDTVSWPDYIIAVPSVSDLAVSRSDDDALLTWTDLGGSVTGYEVWRSSEPYFLPGDGGSERIAQVGAEASYSDPDALGTPGTSCFYLVVPIGGGSTAYPPSNRVGVVNFALTAGGP